YYIGSNIFPDVLLNDIAGPEGDPLLLSLKLAVDVLVRHGCLLPLCFRPCHTNCNSCWNLTSSGSILIVGDSRNWAGEQMDIGNYSVSYRFDCVQYSFSWYLIGVYALHSRYEKNDCWEEIAAMRGICGGHWVTCGDFSRLLLHLWWREGVAIELQTQ
ncbi:hypothetical protein H5410_041610, partial [Solanum commersonii]